MEYDAGIDVRGVAIQVDKRRAGGGCFLLPTGSGYSLRNDIFHCSARRTSSGRRQTRRARLTPWARPCSWSLITLIVTAQDVCPEGLCVSGDAERIYQDFRLLGNGLDDVPALLFGRGDE
jgi:hypothetical protein